MELKSKFQEFLDYSFDLAHPVLFELQQKIFFDRLYSHKSTVFSHHPDAAVIFLENDYCIGIEATLLDSLNPIIALQFIAKAPIYDEDNEIENFEDCFNHKVEINLSNESGNFSKMLKRLIEVAQNELENIPTNL